MPLIRGNCNFSKMTMRRTGVRMTMENVRKILLETFSFSPDDMGMLLCWLRSVRDRLWKTPYGRPPGCVRRIPPKSGFAKEMPSGNISLSILQLMGICHGARDLAGRVVKAMKPVGRDRVSRGKHPEEERVFSFCARVSPG